MKKEFLLASMPKMVLAIVLIVCVGAVMGLMGYALVKKQTRVPEIKIPDKVIEDKIVNWQTYQNEEFGFEMKYPEKYKIYDYADKIIDKSSTIKEYSNPIANFTKEGQQDVTACMEYWETREGYLDFHGSEPDFIIETNKSGYIVIDYSPGINYPVSSELKKEWETVISTFKFIEKDETVDWRTYRNEEFGFEVKYSKEWKAIEEDRSILFFDNPFYANEYELSEGPEFENKYRDYAFIVISGYPEGTQTSAGTVTKDTEIKDFVCKLYSKDCFISKEMMIGGQKAYMFSHRTTVYFKQNNDIRTISMQSGSEYTDHKKLTVTFDQILSSFKFIEEDETAFQEKDKVGFFGTLTLTGYLDIKEWVCEEVGVCDETVDYASFVFEETDNDLIYDFLDGSKGNSFVRDKSIGIGCYDKDKNIIHSMNLGDSGRVENIISGEDLNKLLDSDKDNLVKLKLTKPVPALGMGAPTCYSHFRLFEVL